MSVSVTIDAITRNVDVTVSNQRGTPGVDGAGTWNDLTGTAPVIPFEPVPAPSHEEGLLFYDETDKSLTYYNDEADVAMNIGREMWIRVRNDSGAAILNGKVVYINDAQGQFPTIRLARADTAISSRVIGIATHDIKNNEFGYVTTVGEVKGLNTSAFDDGDLLFLSAVTAGEMTITAPLAPNRVVQVATVIHAHPSQGKLYCHPENDSIPSTGIVDSTATGRALITAANAAAGRTTLGLADGTATLSLSSASTASLTVATSLTLNATTYVYGTGAAAAHRTALGVGESDSPTLRGLTLARDGSNSIAAAVGSTGSLIWTYAGTGSTLLHNANRAGTFTGEVRNSSTDTNAGAAQVINTLGTGDAYTRYTVSAGSWTAGIDNSDGDKYKIGVGATVNLATWFEIAVTGESRFFGPVDLQRTSDSTNFERVGMRWDGLDAKLGTSQGGTGGPRDLVLETGGTERVRITAAGLFSVNGVTFGRGGGSIATNTAAGAGCLAANSTGLECVAVGSTSLGANTTGSRNVALGTASLNKNTSGNDNCAGGVFALFNNLTGSENTAFGNRSLIASTGATNTAIGHQSLTEINTGNLNLGVGWRAGRFIFDGATANTASTSSCFIGANTRALASGQSNQIVIGHDAIGAGSNSVVIGNDSITLTVLKGNTVVPRTSDLTNFERVGMRWDSTTAKVGTSSGGSSPGRDLVLEANSIERQRILASNGNHGIGTQAPASRLSVAGGDIEVVDSASGIILKSPDGTRWRVTISNAGALSAASITPP